MPEVSSFHVLMICNQSVVTQSCPTLCNPMDCSTPGFPDQRHFPELAQIHVHQVGDAIQPSHPLSSLLLPSVFPSIRVFSGDSVLCIRWPEYWSFSFNISPSNEHSNWFPLGLMVWYPCSQRDSQESSPIPQFKYINSLALSFLYSPTLTSIPDYWKNHSLD